MQHHFIYPKFNCLPNFAKYRTPFIQSVLIFWVSLFTITLSHALPTRSIVVDQKGLVATESPAPWIAGWGLDGKALNLKGILAKRVEQGVIGLYVMQCATWSEQCKSSLQSLQTQRGKLAAENISVVLVFTENIKSADLQKWLAQLNISPDEFYDVIIDRYHRSAIRLGAYEEFVEEIPQEVDPDLEIDQPKVKKQTVKRLRLPMSLVVSNQGIVLSIITQEGTDLVSVITKSLRFSGH